MSRLAKGAGFSAALFLMGAAAFAIGWLLSPSSQTVPEAAPSARHTPVVKVVQRVAPSVVNISTDTIVEDHPFHRRQGDPFGFFFQRFFEQPRPRQRVIPNSLGSGVIVDPKGYIITNYHVLVRSNRVRVTLADGSEYDAEAVGADPSSDLAVLRIETDEPLPSVEMGRSSELMIGEPAIAIGNPFGLSHTVTTGVISALNRSVQGPDESIYSDFIQTDASINPGNSGGPLLDIDGRLIGINTAIRPGAEGIGFAIPIDRARSVLEELIAYGGVRPLWLGMRVRELTPQIAQRIGLEPGGLLVTRTFDGGPATRAGIEAGDRIVRAGKTPVHTMGDWTTQLGVLKPGDTLSLQVERDGEIERATLELEALEGDSILSLAAQRLGLRFREPGARDRAAGYPADILIVDEVLQGGPADRRGFREGDIVTHFDNRKTPSVDAFAEAFAQTWDRNAAMLVVVRRGKFYRVILEMD